MNKDKVMMRDKAIWIVVVILGIAGIVYYLNHHQIKMDVKVKSHDGDKSHLSIKND